MRVKIRIVQIQEVVVMFVTIHIRYIDLYMEGLEPTTSSLSRVDNFPSGANKRDLMFSRVSF